MTQLVNYNAAAEKADLAVMVYHTIPSESGTEYFEHKHMVKLSAAQPQGRRLRPNDPASEVEDGDVLIVQCPGQRRAIKRDAQGREERNPDGTFVHETNPDGSWQMEPCGAAVYVPLTGGGEAQEFHARVRHAKSELGSLADARAQVIADVRSRGEQPRITTSGPGAGTP